MYQEETEEDFETLDRGDNFEDEDENLEDPEDTEETEPTEEVEEEEESEDENEEDEIDEESKKKDVRIPKNRFDKALRQRDEWKERSLWLEEQLEKMISHSTSQKKVEEEVPVSTYDFDASEEQYANFLIEGETAKAIKLRREIDSERQKEFKILISQIKDGAIKEAESKSSIAIENANLQTLIKNYENKYPFFNSEGDDYNEEAVDTVNTLMTGYMAKGLSKTEALTKAVKQVAPMFDKEIKTTKTSLGQKRKVEAGKKAAEASKSQPVKTKSSTSEKIDTTKLDIHKMSEKDFAKLTPKELKILRGD